ncbi:unnamed protein product [Enterobius vermicularis]|uniref:Carboxylic ester hydrolase n=1 Tax=Enterobius vermicularis TaxID=51028 RepID=A0A3P6HX69_ENTVE|nr:unnamed protein product [Enterobius vermicularis]
MQSLISQQVVLNDGTKIIGRLSKSANGKTVTEYLGVPYAEPPINERRFKKPVKVSRREVINAVNRPKSCMQSPDTYFGDFYGATMWNSNVPISEDCLYLNIYVPETAKKERNLPVMIWIYGGGFWSGCSTLDIYDGKILASEENVIVITINYRVSVFGFLYLGDENVPGNMGLWDQLESFKWVRQHIDTFGGDPDRVTVFGESAGAASVALHYVSRQSQEYFRRAVLQSGGATSPWATESKQVAMSRAVILYNTLCAPDHPMDANDLTDWNKKKKIIYDCVMKADAAQLLNAEWSPTVEFVDFPWVPVIDNEFLNELPSTSLKTGNFKKNAELLAGSNRDEAIYFIVYQLTNIFPVSSFFNRSDFVKDRKVWKKCAMSLLPQYMVHNPILFASILHEYEPEELNPHPVEWLNSLDKMLGDLHFTCSVNEIALANSEHGGTTYYYYFTHRATQQTWPKWMGVVHGYEINFIFGEPLNETFNYTEEEKSLSWRMMHYWANFARTGNPNTNPDGSQFMLDWPLYTKATMQYMNLTVDSEYDRGSKWIGTGPRRKQCSFWHNHIPTLSAAVGDLDEQLLQWKRSIDQWQNEYMVDWQLQFEQYKKYQSYRYADYDNSGYCQ